VDDRVKNLFGTLGSCTEWIESYNRGFRTLPHGLIQESPGGQGGVLISALAGLFMNACTTRASLAQGEQEELPDRGSDQSAR
jgi:hypothetical protein